MNPLKHIKLVIYNTAVMHFFIFSELSLTSIIKNKNPCHNTNPNPISEIKVFWPSTTDFFSKIFNPLPAIIFFCRRGEGAVGGDWREVPTMKTLTKFKQKCYLSFSLKYIKKQLISLINYLFFCVKRYQNSHHLKLYLIIYFSKITRNYFSR